MEQNLEPESETPENDMHAEEIENRVAVGETNVDEETTNKIQSENLTVEELESRLKIGETVEDEHIAYALYCEYSRAKGFNVKKGKNNYSRKGDFLIGKWFNCSNEGMKDERRSVNKVPNFQKSSSRCGCPAKLKISRTKGQPWRVSVFETSHNHDLLAPDEAYLLRSQRGMTEGGRVLFNMVCKIIPPSKAFGLVTHLENGRESTGFTRKDKLNENGCQESMKRIERRDAIGLLNYLKNKSNTENNFFWNIDVEDDVTSMNVFFRDSQSLADYDCFGDIVSFGTTYKTNKCGLMCAPFLGINHHNKNTVFGFAMLADETQSTFEWLFRTFLESMGFKQPQVIFTDESQAMMSAVQTVFPSAHHRLCQWHINQNSVLHFGSLNNNARFKKMWIKCMRYCDSEEEFEATWKQMDKDYGIGAQIWFNVMYQLRHKWATAFSNDVFSAGLQATSRSEDTNKALKEKIGNTTSLLDCVKDYDDVLTDWRVKEKQMDSHSHHSRPALLARENPLLRHAAEVYTHSIFNLFQIEMKHKDNFKCMEEPTQPGSLSHRFKVISFKEGSQAKFVVFRSDTSEIQCSCHQFETTGIFCSHILRVCSQVNLCQIPERYILMRWTKGAKKRLCFSEQSGSASERNGGLSDVAFVNHIVKKVHDLAMKCKGSEEARNLLTDCINSATEKISAWMLTKDLNAPVDLTTDHCHEGTERHLHEPPLTETVSVHKRHSDDKSKKGKGKIAKHNERSSEMVVDDVQFSERGYCSSQEVLFTPHLGSNLRPFQPNWRGSSQEVPFAQGDICNGNAGEFRMGAYSNNNRLDGINFFENSQGQSNWRPPAL